MITLDDIRFLDDDGEFDRIRRNAEVKSGGDEKVKFEYMELSIIPGFVQRAQKDAKEKALEKLREEERLRKEQEEKFKQVWQELFEGALQKFEEDVVDLQKIIREVDEQKLKPKRKRRTCYGMPRSTPWSLVPASSCGNRSGSDDKRKKKNSNKRKRDEKEGDFQLQGSEKKLVLFRKRPKRVGFTSSVNNGDNNTVGCNEASSFSSAAILPEEFQAKIREMGGEDAMLVLQKKITKSDTDKQQNRLSIPPSQIKAMFLTQQELDETRNSNGKIEITLIEPCLETRSLTFKKWPMSGTFLYVLNGPWSKDVVSNQRNGIVKDAHIQLWAFRVNQKLCFALVNEDIQA